MSNSPISERLSALIAEGVGKFAQQKDISQCQKCPLAHARKRVVVARNLVPRKFFILAEFPEAEDESSEQVFNQSSSTGIILNLIDKLGIQDFCHAAFALKCVSKKYTPDDHISLCVFENLRHELRQVLPQTILCFGMRGFWALSQLGTAVSSRDLDLSSRGLDLSSRGLDLSSRGLDLSSRGLTAGSNSLFTFENQTIEVFLLPTAQELKQFPHWRLPVWEKLAHFKQKKHIDS